MELANIDISLNVYDDMDFKSYIEDSEQKLQKKLVDIKLKERSSDWTENKFDTLSNWMKIAAFYIRITDKCIRRYKAYLKFNTIMALSLSTISGTLSVFSFSNTTYNFALNLTFTVATFAMAMASGLIKIYQIQEKLEEFIKLKQEWSTFSASLSAELLLPISIRQPSTELIDRYKSKFLDLIKTDIDFPSEYKNLIKKEGYSLSHIIKTFISKEHKRLKDRDEKDIPKEELENWNRTGILNKELEEEENRRLYREYDGLFIVYYNYYKADIINEGFSYKPRELTDILFKQYTDLFKSNIIVKFSLKDNLELVRRTNKIKTILDIFNNNNELNKNLINEEFNRVVHLDEPVMSYYILVNWYNTYIQNIEKCPSDITNILINKFSLLGSNEIKSWTIKQNISICLQETINKIGPEALMYYINNYNIYYNLYKNLNIHSDREDIFFKQNNFLINHFLHNYSLLDSNDTTKFMKQYCDLYCLNKHSEESAGINMQIFRCLKENKISNIGLMISSLCTNAINYYKLQNKFYLISLSCGLIFIFEDYNHLGYNNRNIKFDRGTITIAKNIIKQIDEDNRKLKNIEQQAENIFNDKESLEIKNEDNNQCVNELDRSYSSDEQSAANKYLLETQNKNIEMYIEKILKYALSFRDKYKREPTRSEIIENFEDFYNDRFSIAIDKYFIRIVENPVNQLEIVVDNPLNEP